MTKLHELADLGQAIWLDYVRRSFITSGELAEMVDQGIRGVTSNPSIFEKAIVGSADYDDDLRTLVESGASVEEIYEALALDDIQRVADVLRPLYDETDGVDGYVSLEVNPALAHDADGTVAEARRLFAALGRPNVMIKVPATPAGVLAVEAMIGEGINVNVTLIFSLSHYEAVAAAYVAGIEKRAEAGGDVGGVASVASFFVSRVDTAVDQVLHKMDNVDLEGKIALANAKLAYSRFQEIFSGPRWKRLATQGARPQRVLWASTGTKNPVYPDTLYVDGLIGSDTVNTVPPATLRAFLDHGRVGATLAADVDVARARLVRLVELGVDLADITQKLQDDGVAVFAKSFNRVMDGIDEKRGKLSAAWQRLTASLGPYETAVDAALAEIAEERTLARIWARDHTVWKPEPTEITNRLGWLHTAEVMLENLPRLSRFVDEARAEGFTHALLLGMGGSSLAPEVFRRTLGVRDGYLDLAVLDSTDPGAVLAYVERLDLPKTLFIVATKSGGTVETLSFFKFFYNLMAEAVGVNEVGSHFIAITDAGSKLDHLAQHHRFRMIFRNDPNIGGRYSALSYFGLVPAALIGVDLEELLNRALTMACNCESCNCPSLGDNHGGRLGVIMGELAKAGRDKVTFITSPAFDSFGDWVEQLIAESTGKEGKGVLPVVGEPLGAPDVYGDDRLVVYLRLPGDDTHDDAVQVLQDAGYPVVRVHLDDFYDLGSQFFLWEMATVVASNRLHINPFDQPNVEAAKVLARRTVAEYQKKGVLPAGEFAPLTNEALDLFLAAVATEKTAADLPRNYIAIQAFVRPTPETDAALLALRVRLRDRTKLATSVGYGPRFLHSTGQLHKGDAGNGLFIQFTADDLQDIPIPEEAGSSNSAMSFGVLKTAQAVGDWQALLAAGRRVIRFDLGDDVVGGLRQLS
jgi:transaldolase/glucose-6-phosphate isomerase